MESIKVDPEVLKEASQKVSKMAQDYYDLYTRLLGEVDTFTTTDFRGADSDKFRENVSGFRDDFERMRELMDRYGKYLSDTAISYETTQGNLAKQAEGLNNNVM